MGWESHTLSCCWQFLIYSTQVFRWSALMSMNHPCPTRLASGNRPTMINILICFFLQDRNEIPWELNMRILANQKNITPKIADTSHGNSRRKNIKKQPFGRQNTLGRRMMCDNLFAKRLWHARNAQVGAFTPAARKSMSTHVRTISVKTTSAAISQKKWRNNKAATLKGNV